MSVWEELDEWVWLVAICCVAGLTLGLVIA